MLSGWHVRLDDKHLESRCVAAIIICSKFPDMQLVRDTIARAPEDTLFIVRDRDQLAKGALQTLQLPYVSAPLVPYWKGEEFDRRAECRAEEILNTCQRVVVFKTPDDTSTADFTPEWRKNVRIIVAGKAKTKHRKGRAIV